MAKLRSLLLIAVFCLSFFSVARVQSLPSSTFTERRGEWFDDWGYNRNYYGGSDGYLPNLAFETLGENMELAYRIGDSFKAEYPNAADRAEAILKYVQTWTEYGYDEENVFRRGVPQPEWAWNADEMAHALNETTGVTAIGDCEDLSFLCATLFEGAGIDAAVVDAPEHVACLIWMPEYANANRYWELASGYHDGAGWIWVEATGETNGLGWTPPDFKNGNWYAYPIALQGARTWPTSQPTPPTNLPIDFDFVTLIIIAVIVLAVLFALGSAGSSRRRSNYILSPF